MFLGYISVFSFINIIYMNVNLHENKNIEGRQDVGIKLK